MDGPIIILLVMAYVFICNASFIYNPPSNGVACLGEEYSMNWNFDETRTRLAVVWAKDEQSILTWRVSTNQYGYGSGYSAAKVNHTNTNGAITIYSVNASDVGSYTCTVTYSTGSEISPVHAVSVQNVVTANVTCVYDETKDQLNCSLPEGVNSVTINNVTVSSFPMNGNSAEKFDVCMGYTCLATGVSNCSFYAGKGKTQTCQSTACWMLPFLSVLIVGIIVFIGYTIIAFVHNIKESLRKLLYRCTLIVAIILCLTGLISGLIAGLLRLNGVTGFCCQEWNIVLSAIISVIGSWIVIVLLFILLLILKFGKDGLAEENKSDPVDVKHIYDKEKSPRITCTSTGRTGRISPLSFLSMVPKDRELPHPKPNCFRSEIVQVLTKPHHVPPLQETIIDEDGMPKNGQKERKKVKKDKRQTPSTILTDNHEQLPSKGENATISSEHQQDDDHSLQQKQTKNNDQDGMRQKGKKGKKKSKKNKRQTPIEQNNYGTIHGSDQSEQHT